MTDEGGPVSVVIPAHNERASIARLLTALAVDEGPSGLDIVVVCNGCTDDTAEIARRGHRDVTVVETPVASKMQAMALGDTYARYFPRVYLDADVELDGHAVRALAAAVSDGSHLAAGPMRRLDRNRSSVLVRWYYDVWEQLPQVRHGLSGRGVMALSEQGHHRVRSLPTLLSDDLAFSEAFSAAERTVVGDVEVGIRIPRTLADLIRRRVRVATGNAQLDARRLRHPEARTSLGSLLRVARSRPQLAWRLPVFLAVTATARFAAARRVRSGDFTSWLRDESSRQS